MKYVLFYATLAIAAALLTGCATPDTTTNINVTADSFCRVAKKIVWSVHDTPETIDQSRRWNARVDSCTKDKVS